MIKMRWFAACALVLAAGCGSKASDSSSGDSSACTAAIDKGMQSMLDSRKKALDERMGSAAGGADREAKILERSQGVIDKLKVALNTRCAEDKWTGDALTCFSTVARREDVQACIAKLPKDQADKANAEVMKAMTAGMGMRMRPPSVPMGGASAPPGTAPLPGAAPVPEPGAPAPPPPPPVAPTPAVAPTTPAK